jgi:hypothetical protein
VSSDLVNNIIVEVARISKQTAWNVISVLEPIVDLLEEGELGALLELHLLVLGVKVEVLHPVVVGVGMVISHMVLEDNNV